MRQNADHFAAILDEKYKKWDVYRAADGDWIVKLPDNCIRGDTITTALRNAAEFVPLPKYPRRPRLLSRDLFVPYKSGSNWRLRYDGDDACVSFKTKTRANEYADKIVVKQNAEVFDWDDEYADKIEGKVEGVDFLFTS